MDNNTNIENTEVEVKGSDERTYTEAEVQELLQKEADRRVTEAMKKAEKKREMAVKEAQKLAAMNEEEKFRYELEQREKTILEKEKKMALMENRAEASKALNSRGISIELVDLVVAEDAETMMNNIKALEDEFKKSVKAEVERRLGSKTPKKNLGDNQLTADGFKKLSLKRQAELLEENPALYEQFIK